MPRLTIRIDFDEHGCFGPGKARLLELIDAEGSIRRAAAAMEMSYRQAWLLLRDAEAAIGVPLIVTASGGMKGGGTKLSAAGRDVVARYRQIEQIATRAAGSQLKALASAAGSVVPRPTSRNK